MNLLTSAKESLRRHRERWGWRILLPEFILLSLLVALRLLDPAALGTLRNAGYDVLQGLSPSSPQPPSVTVVRIGEASLAEFGPWPWPRDRLAQVVDRAIDAGASSVVLVDLLNAPDRFAARSLLEHVPDGVADEITKALESYPDPDHVLADVLARRPSILATALSESRIAQDDPPLISLPLEGAISDSRIAFSGVIAAIQPLRAAAVAEGAVNLFPERDMVLRRAPTVFIVDGSIHPSIAVAAVASRAREVKVLGRQRQVAGLRIDGQLLQTDGMGRIWLDFSRRDLIATIEASDLAQLAVDGLDGRIAVIGVDVAGLTSRWRLADGSLASGAEVVGSILDAILTGTSLARPEIISRIETAAIGLFGLLTIFVWLWSPPIRALGVTTFGAAAWLGIVVYSRVDLGLVMDAATPIVFWALLAATSAFMRARSLARERELLVSEKLETEQRLFQAQKMEAIGQLTGGIAHDFNNLLTVIYGNLELINARANDPGIKPMVEAAVRSVKRGTGLIKQLLVFGREAELTPKTVDLNDSLRAMQSMIRVSAPASIQIETIYADGLCAVRIDEDQLTSAVLNVVINARDAMPDGGTLTIETAIEVLTVAELNTLGLDLRPERYATLSVADTGIGMDPETIERVFDPFFTTKAVGKGTGLGLSMVYGFIRQSGGDVLIESSPGDGTKVKFYLPATGQTESTSGSDAAPALRYSERGETVLVTEDEEDVRTVIRAQLSRLGYEVVEAADAAEALSILRGEREVDLLLTDVAMPGELQGPALARSARDLRPRIRVVLMTGYPNRAASDDIPPDAELVRLTKPISEIELATTIWNALNEDTRQPA